MSGKKQHFIPQALLRGFGIQRNKQIYVQVFPYGRSKFEVATDGIGAERYFYSKPSQISDEKTLDDKITDYENTQKTVLHHLQTQPIDEPVNAIAVSELVTHLSVRNAHFRDVATEGARLLFEEATSIFQDRDRTRRALGLDGHKPSNALIEALNKKIAEYRETFQILGMTDDDAREWALTQAGPLFEQNFPKMAAEMALVWETIEPRIATIGKDAQLSALEKDLAPETRRMALEKFTWVIADDLHEKLLLPDCVAVALTAAGPQPASFAGADDTDAILMPLSSSRLLVGSLKHPLVLPKDINETMAGCSWRFFVAQTSEQHFQNAHANLRTVSKQFFRNMVEEVTSDYY